MKKLSEIIFQRLQVQHKQDCSFAVQIADQIRWLIVSNQIHPGDRLPAVRELAEHLQVNLHTVRAAYRRLEENKLIFTRRGLGSVVVDYLPSDTISTNSMPTHTFGVIVPDLGNPFYPAFLSGAASVAQRNHVLLITCDTQERYSLGKAHFEMLITKKVDGMLIAPWGLDPDEEDILKGELFDFPIPLVFVDRPNIAGYSVLLDAHNAGLIATRHLINHGHARIAMITGPLEVPTLQQVYQGYCSALEAGGLMLDEHIVIQAKEFTYAEGYRCVQHLIQERILPSAIFAAGDMYAVGAMKALREHNLRVPQDVAIVGYNNIDVADYTQPALTSVSTPIEELGRQSAELLLRLINNHPIVDKKIVLPSELIIRESCGCQISSGFQEKSKGEKEVYGER